MVEPKLMSTLAGLKDMEVGLLLNEINFVEGMLLDVKNDHLVVSVNDLVHYIDLQHIKAISKCAKYFEKTKHTTSYINTNYLEDVVKSLKYNWIIVNGIQDSSILKGVLCRICEEHLLLINNAKHIYVPRATISHITSSLSDSDIGELNEKVHQEHVMELVETFHDSLPIPYETEEEESPLMELHDEIYEEMLRPQIEEMETQDISKHVIESEGARSHEYEMVQEDESSVQGEVTGLANVYSEKLTEILENDAIQEEYYASRLQPELSLDVEEIEIQDFEEERAQLDSASSVSDRWSDRKKKKRKKRLMKVRKPVNAQELQLIDAEPLAENVVQGSAEEPVVQVLSRMESPREQNELIKNQYFSLMRHASDHSEGMGGNSFYTLLDNEEIRNSNETKDRKQSKIDAATNEKSLLQKQYISLRNHAARMYQQIQLERN